MGFVGRSILRSFDDWIRKKKKGEKLRLNMS